MSSIQRGASMMSLATDECNGEIISTEIWISYRWGIPIRQTKLIWYWLLLVSLL